MYHLVARLDLKDDLARTFFMGRWPNKTVSYGKKPPPSLEGPGIDLTTKELLQRVIFCGELAGADEKKIAALTAAHVAFEQEIAELAEVAAAAKRLAEASPSDEPAAKRHEPAESQK